MKHVTTEQIGANSAAVQAERLTVRLRTIKRDLQRRVSLDSDIMGKMQIMFW